LLPVLAHGAGTEIVLLVSLVTEEEVLVTTSEKVEGEVRNYRFQVRRRFVKDLAGPQSAD
jgi:hypothetical protein